MIDLARDLSHGKGMSLLFSSHLLPDVEAVCDDVIVLGRGRLLAEGAIKELKEGHPGAYEVRLKGDADKFVQRLRAMGGEATFNEDLWHVQLKDGQSTDEVWRIASEAHVQIRHLRPQRSSLEEVFLQAVGGQ